MAASGNPFLKLRKLSQEPLSAGGPEGEVTHRLTSPNSPFKKLERSGMIPLKQNQQIPPQSVGGNQNPFLKLRKIPNNPEIIDTFLGKMPSHMSQFESGSPQNKELIDNMLGVAIGSPGIKIAGEVPTFMEGLKSALTKIKPKELAYGVQKGHDVMHDEASNLYNLVKNEVKSRNVKQMDIGEDAIDRFREYLPKTEASSKLLEKARYGDYDALHDLQSDLWKRATKKAASPLAAEQNEAEEIFEQRDKLNNLIHKNLEESGHKDLSESLFKGREIYKKMKDTYYSHPTISKLVEKGIRKVPKNPMAVFSEESDPIKRLLKAHPEIKKSLQTKEIAENFLKKIRTGGKIGIGLGATGGAAYGGKTLYDLISGINS